MRIFTNDPSFTAWGWAVVEGNKIIACGCIKTESEHKKRRIRKGDDTTRRITEINLQLLKIMKTHKVDFLLAELPHGSQNASAAQMIGAVVGILCSMSVCLDIGIEWFSEMDAKKNLFNKKSATKQETIDAIDALYDVPWFNTKYKDEAVADALAIHAVALTQCSYLRGGGRNAVNLRRTRLS